MNKYCLIPVIVLFMFLFFNNSYSSDNVYSGSYFSEEQTYHADHDLYPDQAVSGAGLIKEIASDAPFVPDAYRLSNTEENTILTSSFMNVFATTNTGILLGILLMMLLVGGSITYWRKRKMNA